MAWNDGGTWTPEVEDMASYDIGRYLEGRADVDPLCEVVGVDDLREFARTFMEATDPDPDEAAPVVGRAAYVAATELLEAIWGMQLFWFERQGRPEDMGMALTEDYLRLAGGQRHRRTELDLIFLGSMEEDHCWSYIDFVRGLHPGVPDEALYGTPEWEPIDCYQDYLLAGESTRAEAVLDLVGRLRPLRRYRHGVGQPGGEGESPAASLAECPAGTDDALGEMFDSLDGMDDMPDEVPADLPESDGPDGSREAADEWVTAEECPSDDIDPDAAEAWPGLVDDEVDEAGAGLEPAEGRDPGDGWDEAYERLERRVDSLVGAVEG